MVGNENDFAKTFHSSSSLLCQWLVQALGTRCPEGPGTALLPPPAAPASGSGGMSANVPLEQHSRDVYKIHTENKYTKREFTKNNKAERLWNSSPVLLALHSAWGAAHELGWGSPAEVWEENGAVCFSHPRVSRLEQFMDLGTTILPGVRLLQVPPCPDPLPHLPVPPRMLRSERSMRQLRSAVPEEEKAAY